MKKYNSKYIRVAGIAFFCCLYFFHSIAQTSPADNKIAQTITFHPIPEGPDLVGVFQGRPPCPLVSQWKLPVDKDCEKVKTELILYRDPANARPTTYKISFVG
ncbi:MAG TPA: hypothetical protein VK645_14115, partial [Chitinophagaceae bacterium]|nr:hypothetical protein [Chitinophagaceae bacterium]